MMTRRPFRAAYFCLAVWALAGFAVADETRPVRVVVPAPPGGSLDGTARLLAQRLGAITGETYLIDNRPGANTVIGTELVVRAAPDGRTLLYHGTGISMMSWMQKTSFSALDDLQPVMQVSVERYALVVPATSPARSVRDLEQLAASRPEGLNCVGAPGLTTVACEQFKAAMHGKATTIPYAGFGPALQATAGGHADLMFATVDSAMKLVETGHLRVLAVSQRQGLPTTLAQVPLIAEAWPEFLVEGFSGFFVPAHTPQARVLQLNRDLNRVLAEPDISAAMRAAGQEPAGGTADQFAQTLARANRRYGEIIQKLGMIPK
jgi:tripartite-type tricarboxylate transporter receptor subunit TctC